MSRLQLAPVVLGFGVLALASFVACGDNGTADTSSTSSENGDGDGDGDTTGDGDGDPTGDGDGDPTGDGDGDGDGDGEAGDGDGDGGCTPGSLGCECVDGLCLGALECLEGVCMDPECIPGELGCTCNNGQCLGDLQCEGNVCMEASGDGDGDGDGDPECPEPNEMMCNGQCIDVLNNDDNCGTCGHTCEGSSETLYGGCENGECRPWFTECFQPGDFANCDEACGAEGQTCAEDGCDGATAVLYASSGNCDGVYTGGNKTGPFCNEDFLVVDDWMRCCCFQD